MRQPQRPNAVDRRARWGLLVQTLAYAIVWYGPFWFYVPENWAIVAGLVCWVLADVTAWSATKALGKQWRFDAALNQDHELVRWGAYRFVRHPIYASMLGALLGSGFLITPLPRLAVAFVIFVIGTEIRVRVEEELLEGRFGEEFRTYRRSVPAYLPPVR
jgi:protein-S-isoprenylcysteine O-methyltransferase Ste14